MEMIFNILDLEYDFTHIMRLAGRHLTNQICNFFTGKDIYDFPQTKEDITTIPGSWQDIVFNRTFLPLYRKLKGFNSKTERKNNKGNRLQDCSSFPEMLKVFLGLPSTVRGVHYSQIEPQQFLQDPDYEVLRLWVREGLWITSPLERELIADFLHWKLFPSNACVP